MRAVKPADIVYLYDGSLAGFYTCVHKSVYAGELPFAIYPDGEEEPSFFPTLFVETDQEKALRVRDSIPAKISQQALDMVETVFLSCMKDKEKALLKFLLRAYAEGPRILHKIGDEEISILLKMENFVLHERHLLMGFVRFTDNNDILVSTISPKNFVLPLLRAHFVQRFHDERWLIYDDVHHAAMYYDGKQCDIFAMEGLPEVGEDIFYRDLWRLFYDTIAIVERTNPICRRSHMPKRYWKHMPEMAERNV